MKMVKIDGQAYEKTNRELRPINVKGVNLLP